MKKKQTEPPTDFEVENADAAFSKAENAARRMFAIPQKTIDREFARQRKKRAKKK